MDRCAVFVDGDWFLSEAALALNGRGERSDVAWRYRDLVPSLARLAAEHTGLPLLRIYWYEGAPDGAAGRAHADIGGLPDVKLRRGRTEPHERKGVDGLLVLDLTALARERAIADALVFSGDEAVREGIAVAQGLGVRVTLGAVARPEGRPGVAATLVQEADGHLLLDADFLGRCVTAPVAGEPASLPLVAAAAQPALAAVAPRAVPAGGPAVGPEDATTPREFGFRFGAAHADQLGPEELRALQREAPMIPSDVAAQLFRDAEQLFGPIRGRPEVRRELKAGYWDHVMRRR